MKGTMTKRLTTIILTCITVLATAVPLSACAPQPAETQEEFRAEYIDMLKRTNVLVNPDIDYRIESKKVSLGEGIEIFEEDLKVYLHVYNLDWEVKDVPTAKDIESLYNKYNDEIFNKLKEFYEWYRTNGGEVACLDYESALLKASMNYRELHGTGFNNLPTWIDFTAEDKFELESYIKENPDYSETSSAYKRLLKWLGV